MSDPTPWPSGPDELYARFRALGIDWRTTAHAPASTVAQGNAVWGNISGVHCKNLFLKDAKAKLWLVVVPAARHLDLKALPAKIGSARLSFGSAALLWQVMGVEPGAVTPFALINDRARRVSVVLDRWMMQQPLLNYHPLRNDATTTITAENLRVFIQSCGHRPEIAALDESPQGLAR